MWNLSVRGKVTGDREKQRGQKREEEVRRKGDGNNNDSVGGFMSYTPIVLEKIQKWYQKLK